MPLPGMSAPSIRMPVNRSLRYVSICVSASVRAVPLWPARRSEIVLATKATDQCRNPDAEQGQRDQQLDDAEPFVRRRLSPRQGWERLPGQGHGCLSCCHEPGTLLQIAWSGLWLVVVVVDAAPGAPGGGSTVERSLAFPDIVAVSAITGPLTVAPLPALKTPLV